MTTETEFRKPLPAGVDELPEGWYYSLSRVAFGIHPYDWMVRIYRPATVTQKRWLRSPEIYHSYRTVLEVGIEGPDLNDAGPAFGWSRAFVRRALNEAHRKWVLEERLKNIAGDYSGQSSP